MIIYTALLSPCHHTRVWKSYTHAPHRGEIVFCFRCDSERRVEYVGGPWTTRCENCGYRAQRQTEDAAIRTALTHVRRTAGRHRVYVWKWGLEGDRRHITTTDDPLHAQLALMDSSDILGA